MQRRMLYWCFKADQQGNAKGCLTPPRSCWISKVMKPYNHCESRTSSSLPSPLSHLFSKYLLNIYTMQGTIPGSRANKPGRIPTLDEPTIQGRMIGKAQVDASMGACVSHQILLAHSLPCDPSLSCEGHSRVRIFCTEAR